MPSPSSSVWSSRHGCSPLGAIAVVAASLLGVTGCSSDCEDVCESAKECPNVSAYFQAFDCDDLCDISEDVADSLGCESQFDDYYACMADKVGDDCQAEEAGTCKGESDAYFGCVNAEFDSE